MTSYNLSVHHRRSIRLQGYDYSSVGSYFITMCVQNRENLFGNVADNAVILNSAGEMVKKWVIETENKFQNILIDEYIIMPNHFHCIISILNVGTDLRVCPDKIDDDVTGKHVGSPQDDSPQQVGVDQHFYPKADIPQIVQWFKTMTTNEYINGVKKIVFTRLLINGFGSAITMNELYELMRN